MRYSNDAVLMQCLVQPGRLDIPEFVQDQQQDEQGDRKADTHGQGLYRTVTFTFVAHQEKQCREQAANDQDEGNGNDDFHFMGQENRD